MSLPVVMLSAGTSFVFLLATVYALKNYAMSEEDIPFWPAFAVATALSVVWTFAVAMEWVGVMPRSMDIVSSQAQVAAVTAYVLCAFFLALRGEPDPPVM